MPVNEFARSVGDGRVTGAEIYRRDSLRSEERHVGPSELRLRGRSRTLPERGEEWMGKRRQSRIGDVNNLQDGVVGEQVVTDHRTEVRFRVGG